MKKLLCVLISVMMLLMSAAALSETAEQATETAAAGADRVLLENIDMDTAAGILSCLLDIRYARLYTEWTELDDAFPQELRGSVIVWTRNGEVRLVEVISRDQKLGMPIVAQGKAAQAVAGYALYCAEISGLGGAMPLNEIRVLTAELQGDVMDGWTAQTDKPSVMLAYADARDSLVDYGTAFEEVPETTQTEWVTALFDRFGVPLMPARQWKTAHQQDGNPYQDLIDQIMRDQAALAGCVEYTDQELSESSMPECVMLMKDGDGNGVLVVWSSQSALAMFFNIPVQDMQLAAGWAYSQLYTAGMPEESLPIYEMDRTEEGTVLYEDGRDGAFSVDNTAIAYMDFTMEP